MPEDPEGTSRALAAWQVILAEHLDPGWKHLVKYDRKTNGNVQAGSNGGAITSLGSKYGWHNDGEAGLGMLQISVNADWDELYWLCGTPAARTEVWSCHDAQAPGGLPAQVARHDGVREVAVAARRRDRRGADHGQPLRQQLDGRGLGDRRLRGRPAAGRRRRPHHPARRGAEHAPAAGRGATSSSSVVATCWPTARSSPAWTAPAGPTPGSHGRWVVEGQGRGDLEWDATPRLNDQPSEP